jgi:hypothetical protein
MHALRGGQGTTEDWQCLRALPCVQGWIFYQRQGIGELHRLWNLVIQRRRELAQVLAMSQMAGGVWLWTSGAVHDLLHHALFDDWCVRGCLCSWVLVKNGLSGLVLLQEEEKKKRIELCND